MFKLGVIIIFKRGCTYNSDYIIWNILIIAILLQIVKNLYIH